MCSVRLIAVRRLFTSSVWNCHVLKTGYHTDTAETLRSNVDTSSYDYKVTGLYKTRGNALWHIEVCAPALLRIFTF